MGYLYKCTLLHRPVYNICYQAYILYCQDKTWHGLDDLHTRRLAARYHNKRRFKVADYRKFTIDEFLYGYPTSLARL